MPSSRTQNREKLKVIDQLCKYQAEKTPDSTTYANNSSNLLWKPMNLQSDMININMIKNYPEQRKFLIMMPQDQKYLKYEEFDQQTSTFSSRLNSKRGRDQHEEKSVQQPAKIHFPLGSRAQMIYMNKKHNKYRSYQKSDVINKESYTHWLTNKFQIKQVGETKEDVKKQVSADNNYEQFSKNFKQQSILNNKVLFPHEQQGAIELDDKDNIKSEEQPYLFTDKEGIENEKLWKFNGKELVIKKPCSKYRIKYMRQRISGFTRQGSLQGYMYSKKQSINDLTNLNSNTNANPNIDQELGTFNNSNTTAENKEDPTSKVIDLENQKMRTDINMSQPAAKVKLNSLRGAKKNEIQYSN